MDIYRLTNKNYKIFKKEYKTFFKQIENITHRCYRCQYIPEFIINFENDELIIDSEHTIDIISYINLILNTHLCQMCLSKNDLYFSIHNEALICCGNCREKFKNAQFIIEPRRYCEHEIWRSGRGFPREDLLPRDDCQQLSTTIYD